MKDVWVLWVGVLAGTTFVATAAGESNASTPASGRRCFPCEFTDDGVKCEYAGDAIEPDTRFSLTVHADPSAPTSDFSFSAGPGDGTTITCTEGITCPDGSSIGCAAADTDIRCFGPDDDKPNIIGCIAIDGTCAGSDGTSCSEPPCTCEFTCGGGS